MADFIKTPCQHCPFRRDVKPFLHPIRAEELAYSATNRYNTFDCHKTLEHDDEGDTFAGSKSKVCAGFLSLQHNELGRTFYDEDGFKPSDLAYDSCDDMIYAYEDEEER
jgi:hypothetical protein